MKNNANLNLNSVATLVGIVAILLGAITVALTYNDSRAPKDLAPIPAIPAPAAVKVKREDNKSSTEGGSIRDQAEADPENSLFQ